MTDNAEIARVEQLLVREQKTYDYLVFYIDQVQQKPIEDRTAGDRSQLVDFDRTAIRACNKELSILESVANPTHERRQLLKQLDELSVLLDIAVNRALALRDEQKQANLEALYPAYNGTSSDSEFAPESESPSSRRSSFGKASPSGPGAALRSSSKNGCIGTDPYGASGGLDSFAAQPSTDKSVTDELPPHTPVVPGAPWAMDDVATGRSSVKLGEEAQSKSKSPTAMPAAASSGDTGNQTVGPDPLGLYTELGLPKDTPLPAVQKAIKRRMMVLHPDRFPNDADGSHHRLYTDFTSRFRLFDKEKGRAAYDEIKTEEYLIAVKSRYV